MTTVSVRASRSYEVKVGRGLLDTPLLLLLNLLKLHLLLLVRTVFSLVL